MFFQNAYEGRTRWWRWLLTILMTVLAWLLGQIPLIIFADRETVRLGIGNYDYSKLMLHPDLDRNLFLLLALFPFVVGFITLHILIILLHKRSLRSVMTGRPRFDWARAWMGFAVWLLLIAAASFALSPTDSYTYQFNPSAFWPLLAIGLLLLPVQTTLEELFFRGYLVQGASLLFKNKLAPFLIITLLFTLMHFGNPEFSTGYTTGFLAYLSVGALLGIVAILDDGIEVPCGIHAANNLFAAVVMSTKDGSFVTDSFFVTTLSEAMTYSPYAEIGICLVGFLIFFKLYGWRFSTLFAPTVPAARSEMAGERGSPDAVSVTAES